MSVLNLNKKNGRKRLKEYFEAIKSQKEDSSDGDEFQYGDGFTAEQADKLQKELGLNLNGVYQVGLNQNPGLANARKEWKKADMDIAQFAQKNDEAIDRIICTATKVLRAKGYDQEAEDLQKEHSEGYQTAVSDLCAGVVRTGIGDHRPLSQWLAKVYDKLEAKLGTFIMEATRLRDIKIFNYCIPVCFNPKGDPKINPLISWGLDEYLVHFVALASVTAYWVTWAICVGLTWGMGAVSFLCNLPAMGIERLIATKVAPNWGKRVYLRANPNEVVPVGDVDFDYVCALA
jgi:hypothetical protein